MHRRAILFYTDPSYGILNINVTGWTSFVNSRPLLKATGELDKRVFPWECTLLNSILHPVANLGIPELLEGADVALVGVLYVVKGTERIHRREVIDKEMTSSKKGVQAIDRRPVPGLDHPRQKAIAFPKRDYVLINGPGQNAKRSRNRKTTIAGLPPRIGVVTDEKSVLAVRDGQTRPLTSPQSRGEIGGKSHFLLGKLAEWKLAPGGFGKHVVGHSPSVLVPDRRGGTGRFRPRLQDQAWTLRNGEVDKPRVVEQDGPSH